MSIACSTVVFIAESPVKGIVARPNKSQRKSSSAFDGHHHHHHLIIHLYAGPPARKTCRLQLQSPIYMRTCLVLLLITIIHHIATLLPPAPSHVWCDDQADCSSSCRAGLQLPVSVFLLLMNDDMLTYRRLSYIGIIIETLGCCYYRVHYLLPSESSATELICHASERDNISDNC